MKTPSPQILRWSAAAVLCLALSGCAGPRVNLWPLYFQETQVGGGRQTTLVEAGYPLFSLHKEPDRYWYAVRPLFNYESNPAEDYHRLQYFWPFGLQRRDGEQRWYHRFWPFLVHTQANRPDGQQHTHGLFFPLLFWGDRPPEGAYFAAFPLGGVTHGLLGDTLSFFAFPLYSYYRQGEYSRYNIAWPFLSIGATPDGTRKLLRIWPFYVHNWRKDMWDHHYLVWPFVRWGQQQWQAGGHSYVRTYTVVHPVFAVERCHDEDGNLVASRSKIFGGSRNWDHREGHEAKGWTFLWTLIRRQTSSRGAETAFIPFFWQTVHYPGGRQTGQKWTRTRLLWPIGWVDSRVADEKEGFGFILAPVYWHYTTRYTAGENAGKTDRSITLWPIVSWRSRHDGAWKLSFLSSGWQDASDGFKRNYRAFFELFQVNGAPDGQKETRVLWRLYHHKHGPRGSYLSFGPLTTYDGIGDAGAQDRRSFSCLFGLVKYYWSDEGTSWRVLYLPLGK